MKHPTSIRLTEETINQIDRLKRTWDVPVSSSTIIRLAVSLLARERLVDDATPSMPRGNAASGYATDVI